MSRNFTPEQTLIDRLASDDTTAFEELSRRYCYSLYTYCMSKLNSSEDAKRIVRNIFIALWEDRQSLPIDFSISLHLYTEVRKSVVQSLNNKLNKESGISVIEDAYITAKYTTRADDFLGKGSVPLKAFMRSRPGGEEEGVV